MQTAGPTVATSPDARPPKAPWARWFKPRAPQAVTAVMMGERCLAARVELAERGGRMKLAAVAEGSAAELRGGHERRLFADSQAVLVLRSHERHLITLDKPEVPDAELHLAVRWPLAEALEVEAEQLLTSALVLPRINPALHPQVLAVAGRLDVARAHLKTLQDAGIKVRAIDVSDSALRGMSLLQGGHADADGWVVLAFIGADVCIGLLWRSEFCALRTLALPVRRPRDESEFEEHLALHIQRTSDHFERQATQLSVRHVLASMPSLSAEARESVRATLPLSAKLFELGEAFEMSGTTAEHCEGDNDLTALACVAASRLADMHAPPQTSVATSATPQEVAA